MWDFGRAKAGPAWGAYREGCRQALTETSENKTTRGIITSLCGDVRMMSRRFMCPAKSRPSEAVGSRQQRPFTERVKLPIFWISAGRGREAERVPVTQSHSNK